MAFDAGTAVGKFILSRKELKKALDQSKKDFKTFGKDTTKEVGKMDKAWGSFKKGLAVLGLVAIINKIKKFASEAIQQFARLEQSTNAVNNLLKKYGQSWDDLYAKMKKASAGMVSEMELLTKTGMGLSLGLAPDDLVEMMEIARSTARAMGKDVGYMFESLTTGVARQSKLWLDNLGIIVSVEEANKKYAKSLGKTVKELTDAERRQAFTNVALEKGRELMKRIGNQGISMSEVIQKGSATFNNMKTAIGELLTYKFALGDTIAFWINQFEKLANRLQWAAQNAGLARRELASLSKEQLRRRQFELKGEIALEAEKILPGRGAMLPTAKPESRKATKEEIENYIKINKLTKEQGEELKKAKLYISEVTTSYRLEGKELDELILKQLSSADATDEQRKTYGDYLEKVSELEKVQRRLKAEMVPEPEKIEGGVGPGGGAERERKREEGLQRLEEQEVHFMTEEEKAFHHHEKMLEELSDFNLTEEEYRQGKILAEQITAERLEEIERKRIESARRAGEEEYRIRKAAGDKIAAAEKAKQRAKEENIKAYTKSARLGVQIAIGETKLLSKIFAGFEIAEAAKEMGRFLGTKDPSHLVSSLQHILAAKQYLKAAKGASGGGGGGGAGAGAGGGRGGGYGAGAGTEAGPGGIREEDRKPMGPPVNLQVNFHGAVLDDDKLQEWMVNNFSPQVQKLVNAGRIDQTWSRQ